MPELFLGWIDSIGMGYANGASQRRMMGQGIAEALDRWLCRASSYPGFEDDTPDVHSTVGETRLCIIEKQRHDCKRHWCGLRR
jgi:hypothetical protein